MKEENGQSVTLTQDQINPDDYNDLRYQQHREHRQDGDEEGDFHDTDRYGGYSPHGQPQQQ